VLRSMEPEIGATLVDDAASEREADWTSKALVMRVLLDVAALRVHGEDIHGAVRRRRGNRHGSSRTWDCARCRRSRGEGNGFGAGIVTPDISAVPPW